MKHYGLLIIAICLALVCGGCHDDAIENETTETPAVSDTEPAIPDLPVSSLESYRVVVAEGASDAVMEAAQALRSGLASHLGVSSIAFSTDYEFKAGAIDTTRIDTEILIGMTNRDESQALASMSLARLDYVIDYSSTRIAILGGSEEALLNAVHDFLSRYCTENDQVIPGGWQYCHRHDNDAITVESVPLSQFVLSVGQGVSEKAETTLVDTLFRQYGLDLAKVSEIDAAGARLSLRLHETWVQQYGITITANTVCLEASSAQALEAAVDAFLTLLTQKTALTAEDSVTESMSAVPPSYTEATVVDRLFVEGLTHKDALSYAVGEEILFRFRVTDSGKTTAQYACPLFTYTARADDGQTWSGRLGGEGGEITLRFTLKKPGHIQVFVKACDANGNEIPSIIGLNGGACAGFEEITTVKEEPDDFWEFWQKQLKELEDVAPTLIAKTEVKGKNPSFYCYDIRIQTNDTPASAWLTIPKNAEPGMLKLKMIYQGYGQNDPILEFNPGYITVSVNSHSVENGRDNAYYSQVVPNNFGFHLSEYTDPSRAYFRNMLLRDVQAFRFAKTLPEWDGETAVISGISMGGFQSIAVAALEPGCTNLNTHITWMCDVGGRTDGRIAGWLPPYTDALLYFDTVYFASRVTAKTNLTAGLADPTSMPCGITACYLAIRGEKTLTFLQKATHSTALSVLTPEYTRSAPAAE
ncbi:MAG: acetylxylan esterase [Ruminococcaceae bacterium]|nr:acetylxylan esterase [Oscillospiraceae bacterium]